MNRKLQLGLLLLGAVVGFGVLYLNAEVRRERAEREYRESLPSPVSRMPPDCSPEGIKKMAASLSVHERGHAEYSTHTDDLIECGAAAIPAMLEIMERDEPDDLARLRARVVLNTFIARRFATDFNAPVDDPKRVAMTRWFNEHGRFDPQSPVEERRRVAAKWREGLKQLPPENSD